MMTNELHSSIGTFLSPLHEYVIVHVGSLKGIGSNMNVVMLGLRTGNRSLQAFMKQNKQWRCPETINTNSEKANMGR